MKKLSIKNSEKQNIIDCNIALRKMSETSQLTFFKNLLKSKTAIKSPNGLIVENKILLAILLSHDTINPENLFKIYSKAKNMKKYKIEEICVVCNKVSEDAKNIIANFDLKITLFTPTETYALMKRNSFFPELTPTKQKLKTNFFKETFVKNKGKQFIKCSLFLYILSIVVPFSKYYLISASILMILGLSCLIFCKNKVIIEPLSKQILLS